MRRRCTLSEAVIGQATELRLDTRQRVPVAGHQQLHGKFIAERGHAALGDVAAAVGDHARQLVHHAGVVTADGGYGQMLLAGSDWVVHDQECTGFRGLLQATLDA